MCANNNLKDRSWMLYSIIFMIGLIIYAPMTSDMKMNLSIIVSLIIFHKSQAVVKINTAQKAVFAYIIAIAVVLWLAF